MWDAIAGFWNENFYAPMLEFFAFADAAAPVLAFVGAVMFTFLAMWTVWFVFFLMRVVWSGLFRNDKRIGAGGYGDDCGGGGDGV